MVKLTLVDRLEASLLASIEARGELDLGDRAATKVSDVRAARGRDGQDGG